MISLGMRPHSARALAGINGGRRAAAMDLEVDRLGKTSRLSAAVVLIGPNETPKLALPAGVAVFVMACHFERAVRFGLMVAWIAAGLGVALAALLAHRLELHNAACYNCRPSSASSFRMRFLCLSRVHLCLASGLR